MEKQLLLALSVLALGCYSFAKPNEEPSVKINITVNTDQGSTHESVALVNEDGKWKALKDRNGGARQRSISGTTPRMSLPGVPESGNTPWAGRTCCRAVTAEYNACYEGMEIEEYCKQLHPPNYQTGCTKELFDCKNGRLLNQSLSLICNGIDDCGNNLDENQCSKELRKETCPLENIAYGDPSSDSVLVYFQDRILTWKDCGSLCTNLLYPEKCKFWTWFPLDTPFTGGRCFLFSDDAKYAKHVSDGHISGHVCCYE